MSGCCSGAKPTNAAPIPPVVHASIDPSAYIQKADAGLSQLSLIVDTIHCPSCIRLIEGNLNKLPGIETARVNLSTKRLFVLWDETLTSASSIVKTLDDLDFPPTPF